MMTHTTAFRTLSMALMAVGLLMAGGCAAGRGADGSADHVFYPEAPAAPRLQFLTSFSDAASIQRTRSRSSFADWIVGENVRPTPHETRFRSPYGVAVHENRLYLCDLVARSVHVLDLAAGEYRTLDSSHFRAPVNVAVADDGTKYVSDAGARKVFIFDAGDRYVGQLGLDADWSPFDLQIRGEELFITNTRAAHVEVWSKQGELLRTIGEPGEGPQRFAMPTNLAFGPDGQLYVVDTYLRAVKVFDPDQGYFLRQIGGPGNRVGSFARPKGIAIDANGVVYVGDSQYNVVQMFEPSGQLLMVFGEPGRQPWSMGMPAGLAIDRSALEVFRPHLAEHFAGEHLLFVINQFGEHKVSVFAFGRDMSLPAEAYEVDMEAVEARRRALREREARE